MPIRIPPLAPSAAFSLVAPRLEGRYELFAPQAPEGATVVVGRRSRHFPDGEAERVMIDDPVVCPEHFLAELHHRGLWVTPLENRESSAYLGPNYGTWIERSLNTWHPVKKETLVRPRMLLALGPVHRIDGRFHHDASCALILKLEFDGRTLSVESPLPPPPKPSRPPSLEEIAHTLAPPVHDEAFMERVRKKLGLG